MGKSKALLALLVFALVALRGVSNAGPALPEEVPCTSGRIGPGALDHQLCLSEHILSYGGYYYEGPCTIVAFLVDLGEEENARALLDRLARATLERCSNNHRVEIRKAQYSFTELRRWSHRATTLLLFDERTRIPEVRSAGGFPFFNNRIGVYTSTEAALAKAREVLRENGLPLEAFDFSSSEGEEAALAETRIAPSVRSVGADREVAIPVFKWYGDVLGELVLGRSSMSDALSVAPAFAGYGPQAPGESAGSFASEALEGVMGRIRLLYNPAYTQAILGFDERDTLILLEQSIEPARVPALDEAITEMTNMRQVHRMDGLTFKQGDLTPCVVLETVSVDRTDGEQTVAYMTLLYVCDVGG